MGGIDKVDDGGAKNLPQRKRAVQGLPAQLPKALSPSGRWVGRGASIPSQAFCRRQQSRAILSQVLSPLEAVLAMPCQERRMRPFKRTLRWDGVTCLIDHGADTVGVIGLPADKNCQIIIEAD